MISPSLDSSSSQATASGNSLTVSKASSGDYRLGIVALSVYGPNKPDNLSVTWGGVAMRHLASWSSNYSANRKVIWYYIIDPPTVAANVVASWTTAASAVMNVTTFKDVDPFDPFGTVATSVGSSGTTTVNVTAEVGDLVIDATINETGSKTVGAGQTQIYNNGGANYYALGSYELATGTTVTMSWNGTNNEWYQMGVALKPVRSYPKFLEMF